MLTDVLHVDHSVNVGISSGTVEFTGSNSRSGSSSLDRDILPFFSIKLAFIIPPEVPVADTGVPQTTARYVFVNVLF
jgi:hypothetical protein